MSGVKTEDSANGVSVLNGEGPIYEDKEENDNCRCCYGLLTVKIIINVYNTLLIQKYNEMDIVELPLWWYCNKNLTSLMLYYTCISNDDNIFC